MEPEAKSETQGGLLGSAAKLSWGVFSRISSSPIVANQLAFASNLIYGPDEQEDETDNKESGDAPEGKEGEEGEEDYAGLPDISSLSSYIESLWQGGAAASEVEESDGEEEEEEDTEVAAGAIDPASASADAGAAGAESLGDSKRLSRRSVLAGQSLPRAATEGPQETTSGSWSQCDAASFSLRVGPNYAWNKQKAPSPPALMELLGIDLFRSNHPIRNLASKITFPDEWILPVEYPNQAKIPQIFVVNVHVPEQPPASFFSGCNEKGSGWCLAFYFRISEETRAGLIDPSRASAAAKLWTEYVSTAPEDEAEDANSAWKGRFKFVVTCNNLADFELPSVISSYNSKPVLIRRSGTLSRGENYVEMAVNGYMFGSLAVATLVKLMDKLNEMVLSFGFCIESRQDEEMPETVLGCGTVHRPDIKSAPVWSGKYK